MINISQNVLKTVSIFMLLALSSCKQLASNSAQPQKSTDSKVKTASSEISDQSELTLLSNAPPLIGTYNAPQKCGIFIEKSNIDMQESNVPAYVDCSNNYITLIYAPQIYIFDGKSYKVQMVAKILASDHQWKINSTSEVEGTKKGLSILAETELGGEARKAFTSKLSTQIAIGTASIEGDDKSEYERANNRAVKIREFITQNYQRRPEYILNLGRFNSKQCEGIYYTKATKTKYQRPIIIVSFLRESNSPEPTKEDLIPKLQENLDSLGYGLSYKCYSNFDLTR
jgi:hypothetical protein